MTGVQTCALPISVGIVTDGSAIAALGHIGLRAGLPVLEGKAALFASLVGISGIPILVENSSVDHFVEVVCAIAPSFWGHPAGGHWVTALL